jgi:hypothetical protein
MPRLPFLADPRRALPRHSCVALLSRAAPCLAVLCRACDSLPRQA